MIYKGVYFVGPLGGLYNHVSLKSSHISYMVLLYTKYTIIK